MTMMTKLMMTSVVFADGQLLLNVTADGVAFVFVFVFVFVFTFIFAFAFVFVYAICILPSYFLMGNCCEM